MVVVVVVVVMVCVCVCKGRGVVRWGVVFLTCLRCVTSAHADWLIASVNHMSLQRHVN